MFAVTIDPEGCTDADDAFSIIEEDSTRHLYIHIADPTRYMDDNIFRDIIAKGQTRYPFSGPPEHLFPDNILDKCSLKDGLRDTISVHTVFKGDEFESSIEFMLINCISYTYEIAADKISIFNSAVELAEILYKKRKGKRINSPVVPTYSKDGPVLREDSVKVKLAKNIIAEFAIHANTVFAQGLSDNSLFVRTVSVPDLKEDIDFTDLCINGISAKYSTLKLPHDIVTGELYTHATSPLRRAGDCIVHLLLKAQAAGEESPFSKEELERWAVHLTRKSKYFKNEQYREFKEQILIWMSRQELPIRAKIKVMSIKDGFLNLMITELNGIMVNVAWTLRTMISSYKSSVYEVDINKINLIGKYDQGKLPDIDNLFVYCL